MTGGRASTSGHRFEGEVLRDLLVEFLRERLTHIAPDWKPLDFVEEIREQEDVNDHDVDLVATTQSKALLWIASKSGRSPGSKDVGADLVRMFKEFERRLASGRANDGDRYVLVVKDASPAWLELRVALLDFANGDSSKVTAILRRLGTHLLDVDDARQLAFARHLRVVSVDPRGNTLEDRIDRDLRDPNATAGDFVNELRGQIEQPSGRHAPIRLDELETRLRAARVLRALDRPAVETVARLRQFERAVLRPEPGLHHDHPDWRITRTDVLERLDDLVSKSHVALIGDEGVGKSWLLDRWIELKVDRQQREEVLQVSAADLELEERRRPWIDGPGVRGALDALANTGVRYVVIDDLDDVDDAAQSGQRRLVQSLLAEVRRHAALRLIAASRETKRWQLELPVPQRVEILPVDPPSDESVKSFAREVPGVGLGFLHDGSRGDLLKVVRHPLRLKLLISRVLATGAQPPVYEDRLPTAEDILHDWWEHVIARHPRVAREAAAVARAVVGHGKRVLGREEAPGDPDLLAEMESLGIVRASLNTIRFAASSIREYAIATAFLVHDELAGAINWLGAERNPLERIGVVRCLVARLLASGKDRDWAERWIAGLVSGPREPLGDVAVALGRSLTSASVDLIEATIGRLTPALRTMVLKLLLDERIRRVQHDKSPEIGANSRLLRLAARDAGLDAVSVRLAVVITRQSRPEKLQPLEDRLAELVARAWPPAPAAAGPVVVRMLLAEALATCMSAAPHRLVEFATRRGDDADAAAGVLDAVVKLAGAVREVARVLTILAPILSRDPRASTDYEFEMAAIAALPVDFVEASRAILKFLGEVDFDEHGREGRFLRDSLVGAWRRVDANEPYLDGLVELLRENAQAAPAWMRSVLLELFDATDRPGITERLLADPELRSWLTEARRYSSIRKGISFHFGAGPPPPLNEIIRMQDRSRGVVLGTDLDQRTRNDRVALASGEHSNLESDERRAARDRLAAVLETPGEPHDGPLLRAIESELAIEAERLMAHAEKPAPEDVAWVRRVLAHVARSPAPSARAGAARALFSLAYHIGLDDDTHLLAEALASDSDASVLVEVARHLPLLWPRAADHHWMWNAANDLAARAIDERLGDVLHRLLEAFSSLGSRFRSEWIELLLGVVSQRAEIEIPQRGPSARETVVRMIGAWLVTTGDLRLEAAEADLLATADAVDLASLVAVAGQLLTERARVGDHDDEPVEQSRDAHARANGVVVRCIRRVEGGDPPGGQDALVGEIASAISRGARFDPGVFERLFALVEALPPNAVEVRRRICRAATRLAKDGDPRGLDLLERAFVRGDGLALSPPASDFDVATTLAHALRQVAAGPCTDEALARISRLLAMLRDSGVHDAAHLLDELRGLERE